MKDFFLTDQDYQLYKKNIPQSQELFEDRLGVNCKQCNKQIKMFKKKIHNGIEFEIYQCDVCRSDCGKYPLGTWEAVNIEDSKTNMFEPPKEEPKEDDTPVDPNMDLLSIPDPF